MSISSISSGTTMPQDFQTIRQQQRQDFSQLAQALQDGDLTGAQKAYADLQSLQKGNQSGTNTNTNSGSSQNPLQADFAALGQALSSGNLSQAQSDFTQLQADLKNAYQNQAGIQGAGAHHGHHHHHAVSSSDSDSNTSGSSSSVTSPNQSNGTATGGLNVLA